MPQPAPALPPLRQRGRRRFLGGAFFTGLAAIQALAGRRPAVASESMSGAILGGPDDYARERRIAMQRGQPLLLFFSLAGCVFCEALRADQLRHVRARREGLGVRLVELRMDDDRPIPGLEPARSPRAIARGLRVGIAPTVVFLDGDREAAQRLVGYSSPDFYGAYLDERIADARSAVLQSPDRPGRAP